MRTVKLNGGTMVALNGHKIELHTWVMVSPHNRDYDYELFKTFDIGFNAEAIFNIIEEAYSSGFSNSRLQIHTELLEKQKEIHDAIKTIFK